MVYENIKTRLEELIRGETNFIANAANFSALIFNSIKDLNWVGFYMASDDELILGPFQGKPACIRIQVGKGVCGTSAKLRRSIIVDDVNNFPGHIACDPNAKSELVIPIINQNILYGVLDIDSPVLNRFTVEDKDGFKDLVYLLIQYSDMDAVKKYYQF